MTAGGQKTASRWWQAFLCALGIAALVFVPLIIFDGGYFIYYGDFNVQQIPFYKLAHEAVRSGDFGWNWYTDLGVNFVGSYSFYLLFSPFFWLTLPFPTAFLPFLMAPLLILKTGCAALTAYLYLERFVRDNRWAVVGSLLYAFSGWMFFNIFFNHFHEVAVFFPLLLLGVEKLVCDDKRCFFAVMVCINAVVNYWFFAGEAVFVVLYVLVRMTDRSWPMTLRKFIRLALEAVLGVGLSAVVMLPSVLAILGNPRTGSEKLLSGWGLWMYSHFQRQPAIIQSLFFPPELPARPNFLPDHGAKWASLSGWLPLFGMTGVLAYFFQRRDDWLKKMLALCLVLSLVPGLNALFVLFNNSYYARWFYMPILLMALATVRALEHSRPGDAQFRRAIKWSLLIVGVYVVMCGLTPNKKDGEWVFGMMDEPFTFWAFSILAAVCLLLVSLLVLYLRRSPRFSLYTGAWLALVAVVFGVFYLSNGKLSYDRVRHYTGTIISGRETVQDALPDDGFARSDAYEGTDNLLMFWHLPNIQTFHSIVPPSIMEFYPQVGVKRDVGSRPEADYYALRPLLSVRWLFIEENKQEQEPMPGYAFYTKVNKFNIYENENFIPMGFGYDRYIGRDQLEHIDKKFRSNLMLRAIVLEEDEAWKHIDILEWLDTNDPLDFGVGNMEDDSANRRAMACDDFSFDKKGFTAHSSLGQETMMFFSVPWEEGWSAEVNGEPAQIYLANVGFMAVRIPAGQVEIRFDYRTPGLVPGAFISLMSLFVWLLYLLLVVWKASRAGTAVSGSGDVPAQTLSWDEFVQEQEERDSRRAHLQRTLNHAARRHLPQELPQQHRTLRFNPQITDHTTDNGEGCSPEADTQPGDTE